MLNERLLDGIAQTTAAHGCHLGGHCSNIDIADPHELDVNDTRLPVIRDLDLAGIEQDRLGLLALDLSLAWGLEDIGDEVPKEIAVRRVLPDAH